MVSGDLISILGTEKPCDLPPPFCGDLNCEKFCTEANCTHTGIILPGNYIETLCRRCNNCTDNGYEESNGKT